ncbi:MAG: class I SAM-dependent methyltransferase family protein [Candidatus Omnitrophica bacterium]|nr:class I SAM-dependent methyltransferase family protein [Candidatus Omnitrophota bacterium]
MAVAISENQADFEKKVIMNIERLKLEKPSSFDNFLKVIFVNPVLNYVFTRTILGFFRKLSGGNQILIQLEQDPGSWKSMLAHYETKPRSMVDFMVQHYISFPMGLKNRQKLVREALRQLIELYRDEHSIRLVAVGCGSGNNILPVLKERDAAVELKAQLFDLDEDAMHFGRQHAEELGLTEEVSFIQSDAAHIEDKIRISPQIIEMIGLIEYLSEANMLRLFQIMGRVKNPKSSILISSIEPRHGIDRFLRRTLGFHLHYRSPGQLKTILSQYGYKRFEEYPEPTGIFSVLIGHTT